MQQQHEAPMEDYGVVSFDSRNWRVINFRSEREHPNFIFNFHHVLGTGTGDGSDGMRLYECQQCKHAGGKFLVETSHLLYSTFIQDKQWSTSKTVGSSRRIPKTHPISAYRVAAPHNRPLRRPVNKTTRNHLHRSLGVLENVALLFSWAFRGNERD